MPVRNGASSLLIAVVVSASATIPSAGYGQDWQREQAALAMIRQTANDICQSAPLEATNQGVNLSGDASAKLGGLVGKLADLGVSGTGQYQTSHSIGVLQSDLITAIQSGNDCKLEVFRKLLKTFFPDSVSAPPQKSPAPPPSEHPERAPSDSGLIFPDSDYRALTAIDLSNLSCDRLDKARNEIFARRGRYFDRDDLKTYYARFSWYRPTTWNPELSTIERTNVQMLAQAARSKSCR